MGWSRLTRAAWCGVLAFGVTSGTASGQERDSLRMRLVRLELDVRVHYGDGTLDGTAWLTLENPGESPVTDVPLQVHRLMTIGEVRDSGGVALPLDQDVVRYGDDSRRQVTQAWVRLPRPLAPGAAVRLEVRWSGFLWGYTETGSRYIRDRVDSAFTILREDALAFPTPAVPLWTGNRAGPRGDFTFEARITVPRGQVVSAGGVLAGRTDADSLTTWVYRSTEPVPFLNIAIAPYRVLDEGGVRVHYFPEDSAGARMTMDAISGAVRRLREWFGPLGREVNLSVMEIPEGFGSQASLAAGIILDARAFRDRTELHQLYHELSHLWNAPDTDRPAPRWNEGLATFLEHRLARELDGGTDLAEYVDRVAAWFLPRFARDSTNLSTPLLAYGRTGKTDLSYTVGFLLFYQLYEVLGPEAFDRAIGGWYQERRTRGGTTEEFVTYVKRSAGVPLDALFDDWVYTTRWYQRLAAGETPRAMIEQYRAPLGPGRQDDLTRDPLLEHQQRVAGEPNEGLRVFEGRQKGSGGPAADPARISGLPYTRGATFWPADASALLTPPRALDVPSGPAGHAGRDPRVGTATAGPRHPSHRAAAGGGAGPPSGQPRRERPLLRRRRAGARRCARLRAGGRLFRP